MFTNQLLIEGLDCISIMMSALCLVMLTLQTFFADAQNHLMCATAEAEKGDDYIAGLSTKSTYAPFQVLTGEEGWENALWGFLWRIAHQPKLCTHSIPLCVIWISAY